MTREEILTADLAATKKMIAKIRRRAAVKSGREIAGYLFLVAAKKNIERMLGN